MIDLSTMASRLSGWCRANEANICFWGGIASVTAGSAVTAYGAWKAHEKWDERMDEECDLADEMSEEGFEDDEIDREVFKHRVGSCVQVGVRMAPGMALTAVGIGLITHSHNVQSNQIIALTAAYNALSATYMTYRDKVRAKIGDDEEMGLALDASRETMGLTSDDVVSMSDEDIAAMLCGGNDAIPTYIPFDERSSFRWSNDKHANMLFLTSIQQVAQAMVDAGRPVWLSDVLTLLGYEDVDESWPLARFVGWYSLNGEKVVIDFGLNEERNYYAGMDWTFPKNDFILHFNHQGIITQEVGSSCPLLP